TDDEREDEEDGQCGDGPNQADAADDRRPDAEYRGEDRAGVVLRRLADIEVAVGDPVGADVFGHGAPVAGRRPGRPAAYHEHAPRETPPQLLFAVSRPAFAARGRPGDPAACVSLFAPPPLMLAGVSLARPLRGE